MLLPYPGQLLLGQWKGQSPFPSVSNATVIKLIWYVKHTIYKSIFKTAHFHDEVGPSFIYLFIFIVVHCCHVQLTRHPLRACLTSLFCDNTHLHKYRQKLFTKLESSNWADKIINLASFEE